MATLFLINNQVVDSHQPYFPPSFRGYRYGDGFFESMRFDNGRVLHLLLHAERIRKSALLLKLNLPSGWDEIAWETQIATLCQKSGFNQARIRLSFIRDTDGFYTPDNNEVCVITEILEEEKKRISLAREGSFRWHVQGNVEEQQLYIQFKNLLFPIVYHGWYLCKGARFG